MQSVEGDAGEELARTPGALDGSLVEDLWQECDGASFGLERFDFRDSAAGGAAQNFDLAEGANASRQQQAAYLRGLR